MDDPYVKVDVSVAGVGSEVVDDPRVKAGDASFAGVGSEGVADDPGVKVGHASVHARHGAVTLPIPPGGDSIYGVAAPDWSTAVSLETKHAK